MSASGNLTEKGDLTRGPITSTLLKFTIPMMACSLLQQCYNIADTFIVGQFLGSGALAAVGSAYAFMVFLTSILIGLSLGSGTLFSMLYGAGKKQELKRYIFTSFVLTGSVALALAIAALGLLHPILRLLQTPQEIYSMMYDYLWIIFCGIIFTFLYNFYTALLRAVGDSVTPLWFLAASVILNIGLDLLFILSFGWGIKGAAWATVISQAAAGTGIMFHTILKRPELRVKRAEMQFDSKSVRQIAAFSSLTCIQQSVMNFGILLVQGLVNSFGTAVMAAFAAAVKIDSFAYMPVQEFGNAFSTFVAQNFGAKKHERIRQGVKSAFLTTTLFSLAVSALVVIFARKLMLVFIRPSEVEILSVGMDYLRIEGAFYVGIGILFLLYGYYRAIDKPSMSVLLTVISLGTRVALAYWGASIASIGVDAIWWSIPIGWAIADFVGIAFYRKYFPKFRRQ